MTIFYDQLRLLHLMPLLSSFAIIVIIIHTLHIKIENERQQMIFINANNELIKWKQLITTTGETSNIAYNKFQTEKLELRENLINLAYSDESETLIHQIQNQLSHNDVYAQLKNYLKNSKPIPFENDIWKLLEDAITLSSPHFKL